MPPPRVESALLVLRRRDVPLVAAKSARAYRSFVRETFGQGAPEVSRGLRRYVTSRQLKRLAHDLGFPANGRMSQLTFDQWLGVFRFVEHECLGHDPTVVAGVAACRQAFNGSGAVVSMETGNCHRRDYFAVSCFRDDISLCRLWRAA